MKKIMKSKKGITLISLVVTIIILLILAGISIGMLSGDNSIIGQAGNAKTQTNIAEEKEILQIASLAAMGKSKYGDITKEKLDSELNKCPEIESTEQTDKGIVVTFKSNRAYLVNSDGDVSSYSDIKIGNLIVKDGNTVLTENCKSIQLGKGLTITFDANIPGGSITSITPNIAFTTTGERSKTFTIAGKTSEGKEITKEYTVNLNGYYNIPDLKVGDFIKYELSAIDNNKVATLNSDVNTYSGESNTQTISRTGTIAENGKEYLLCRVLEMDSNGNPTKIISADGVNSLSLYGANGYNNAVYLINELCETLYSGEQGTTKSLTIEDLENNYFNPTALATAKSSSDYGKKIRYTGLFTKYPLLAIKEKRMGINTTTETIEGSTFNILNASDTALDLSEQEKSDLESGGGTTTNATNGITVTDTAYFKTFYSDSEGENFYKNITLYNIIHKIPTANGLDSNSISAYWIPSRCIEDEGYCCDFRVSYISPSGLGSPNMFTSSGSAFSQREAIRPVITLNSGIQAWYSAKYNNTYNLWNLN